MVPPFEKTTAQRAPIALVTLLRRIPDGMSQRPIAEEVAAFLPYQAVHQLETQRAGPPRAARFGNGAKTGGEMSPLEKVGRKFRRN